MMMKLTAVAVLSACALWPVGSASAITVTSDTLIVNGTSYFLPEGGEANTAIFVPLATPPIPSGGVALTENSGAFNSDVLFYNPSARGLFFVSSSGGSLSATGFTALKESGQLQNVGSYFGLAPGAIQVQSAAATPLPPTWTIMLLGLAGLGLLLHRKGRAENVDGLVAA
jgi:hypothetical protein